MLLFMAVSLGWALLFLTDTLQPWHAVVLLTMHGMAGVLWGPASQVLIHDIVGAAQLQSAVRLNATSRNLGILMGPAVGGGLMLLFGPAVGLLVNVLIYLPLICVAVESPVRAAAGGVGQRGSRPVARVPRIALLREASMESHAPRDDRCSQAPRRFSSAPRFRRRCRSMRTISTPITSIPRTACCWRRVPAVLSSAASSWKAVRCCVPSRAVAMVLTILWSLAIGGFAMTDSYPLAVGLMFVAGFLYLAFSSMAQTLVQVHAPAHLRGRLVGLFNMSSNGLRAFSGITVGFLGGLIGIHWSLALSALAVTAVTSVLLAFSMRQRRD